MHKYFHIKHDSFDDYFYHKRIEKNKKGADTNVLYENHLWESFKTTVRRDLDFLVDVADGLVQASSILQTGIGIIEIGVGITGLGSSGASAIAIPAAIGSWALIADGAVKVGIGVVVFRKGNNNTELQTYNKVNPKIYQQLEKQYIRDGKDSIFKGLKKAEKTLQEHKEKLLSLKYKSQVQGTIKNIEKQIKTTKKFLLGDCLDLKEILDT